MRLQNKNFYHSTKIESFSFFDILGHESLLTHIFPPLLMLTTTPFIHSVSYGLVMRAWPGPMMAVLKVTMVAGCSRKPTYGILGTGLDQLAVYLTSRICLCDKIDSK